MVDDKREVLNALLAKTNDAQGKWTSRRALRTTTVAHGRVTPEGFDTAVEILVEEGLAEVSDGSLRPTDTTERIPHPGEV